VERYKSDKRELLRGGMAGEGNEDECGVAESKEVSSFCALFSCYLVTLLKRPSQVTILRICVVTDAVTKVQGLDATKLMSFCVLK